MSKNVFQLMRGMNLIEPNPTVMWSILNRELSVLKPSPAEREVVRIGLEIAFRSHEYARARASGEAYIFHPWRSAIRMIRIQRHLGIKDVQVIVAILLHDSIEDAKESGKDPLAIKEEINEHLGEAITTDVLHLTQLSHLGETDEEFYVRILGSGDWRRIAAKLVERTDNIKTIRFMPPPKQTAKIHETEKWLHILFAILKTIILRKMANSELPAAYGGLPHVLYNELRRALRKERKRLGMK